LEANRAYAHIQGEAERRLRVEKMLKDAQAQDEAEDRLHGAGKRSYEPCEGDEMPNDLADPRSRRARRFICFQEDEVRPSWKTRLEWHAKPPLLQAGRRSPPTIK